MGGGPIRCMIGFSAKNIYPFSEELEAHAARMERAFRIGHDRFLGGMARIHDGVDAALDGDREAADSRLDDGLRLLDESSSQLGRLGESIAQSRRLLEAKAAESPDEPLVARERFFASIDFDRLYDELAGAGAALPQKALWQEVASAVARGGACEGLRLEEKTLRRLQGALRDYAAKAAARRHETLSEVGAGIHGLSMEVAVIMTQWLTLIGYATYLSVICERAMLMHESAEAAGDQAIA